MKKYAVEVWRDGELVRVFDCHAVHRQQDGTCVIILPPDRVELVTGDELRFDCDSLIELMQ
jgi:hypothetical protein